MIRVGIVGCGRVAEKHLGFINKADNAEVVALVDIAEDNARKLGSKYGVRNIYTSLEDMVNSTEINVLHILTPPVYHYSNATLAIKNNINVLIEKPMVLRAEEAFNIYKLADEKKVSVCVDYIHLFTPCMQEAIKLIKSGRYGRIIHIESYYCPEINQSELRESSRDNKIHWSYELPGGILHNYISHPLYLVLYWIGKPKRVTTVGKSFGTLPQGLTDHLDILIEGDEINANITLSCASRPPLHYLKIFCEKGVIFVNLNALTVLVDDDFRLPRAVSRAIYNLSQSYQLFSSTLGNSVKHIRRRLVPYHGLMNLIDDYYKSLKNDTPPPVSRELVLAVSETEEVILASAGKVHFDHTPRPSKQKGVVNSSKVLVTGASGFVGKELVRHLVDKGYYVRAFVRKLSDTKYLEDMGVEIIYGDIRDHDSLFNATDEIDIIVHLAAGTKGTKEYIYDVCVNGTKNLVNVATERGVNRIIYMSSMSVYDYGAVKNGATIGEDSLLERNPELRGAYSLGKREAEKIILSHLGDKNPCWTVLRPSMIFGNGSNLFSPLGIKLGKFLVVFGNGSKRLRLIHIEDVCFAIIKVMENDNTKGKVYNVSHYDTISVREYIENYVKTKYKDIRVLYLPYWIPYSGISLFELFSRIKGKEPKLNRIRLAYLYRDLLVNSSAIRNDTGWQPVEGLREQLRKGIEAC